jgi:hypothetical protein
MRSFIPGVTFAVDVMVGFPMKRRRFPTNRDASPKCVHEPFMYTIMNGGPGP